MTEVQGFDRLAVDPFHTGEALKDYVTPTRIDLDYVPGVTQLGYLYELLTNAFGERWLRSGRLSVRFVAPLYNGEAIRVDGRVVVEGEAGEVELEVWVAKDDGTRTVVGTAWCAR